MNDLIILAALWEGPKHGYALKKQAGLISGQTEMHNNLVYPLLRRFVGTNWVTRKKAAGERGQTRQIYSLTPAGRKALIKRTCDFGDAAIASAKEFRLRVGLFPLLNRAAREEILEKRKAYLLLRVRRFGPLPKEMDLGKYGSAVVAFIRRQIKNELVWIEQIRRLNRRQKTRATKTVDQTYD